jgi:hypothetical protein
MNLGVEELVKRFDNRLEKKDIRCLFKIEQPIVTLASLSLFRYNDMIETLKHNSNHCTMPLNMCLRVQAAEEMSVAQKLEVIKTLTNKYRGYDLQFTYKNHGTGVPRHDVVHRALDHFDAEFVATLDDDIRMPMYGLELLVAFLKKNPDVGAASLWCHPFYNSWFIDDKFLTHRPPKSPIEYVDAAGSGTMMVRREVFKTCDLDNQYYIGWCDMDFCMQMRKNNWKIAIISIGNFKATNAATGGGRYNRFRWNREAIEASEKRFRKKWGISIKT